jgi:hypothetical protein
MTSPPTQLPEAVRPTRTESVKFRDGMIVTADHLESAMRYPASMLHTVLKGYFGCGVVCGLELKPDPRAHGENTFVLCVTEGVAFDCNGYPLELCGGVKLDLSPDPCSCDAPPKTVYIAIRRVTSDEAPNDPCTCDTDDPRFQCSRIRDHVKVKAFAESDLAELGPSLCERKVRSAANAAMNHPNDRSDRGYQTQRQDHHLCECLTTCSDCACTDVSWVLLGAVSLGDEGIRQDVDYKRRKYVRPTQCLCDIAPILGDLSDRLKELDHAVEALQNNKKTLK